MSVLTPEIHRARRLHIVVKAFALAHDLEPADKRAVVGKATAIRLLVESGSAANAMAKSELAVLHGTVKGMTEVGDWPDFITKYIDELDRSL